MPSFVEKFFKRSNLFTGAFILGMSSLISRLLGLIRDRLFASTFGAGDSLDAYYAAFRIPDFIFNLLILGALSSAFVPVFVQYLSKNKKREAWMVASSLFNILLAVTVVICVLIFIFMDKLVFLVAPGFDEEKKQLTILLTRIMLMSPIFFGISNIFSCILNSFKKFISYALAPIVYNLGIIFGVIFFVPKYEVVGLAMGVALGSFLHAIIQLPAVIRLGFRWKPVFNLKHEGVLKIAKLMVPRSLALGFNQINLWLITVIASTITAGSIAVFNLANNLQSFPIGIFGVSLAIAAFPCLAEAVAKNNTDLFKNQFSKTFSKIIFYVVPISAIILLERAQIVRLILGSGNFDWNDTILTANSLGLFSLSIFAQALLPLLARSFYSLSDTRTPVIISVISIAINIVASLMLAGQYGVLGLALAFSISSFINMILLLVVLRIRVGDLKDIVIFKNGFKTLISTIILIIMTYISLRLFASIVDMNTYIGILIQAFGAAAMGLIVYIAASKLMKHEDSIELFEDIKNLFSKNKC